MERVARRSAEALASELQAEGAWREACWLLLQAGADHAQSKEWPQARCRLREGARDRPLRRLARGGGAGLGGAWRGGARRQGPRAGGGRLPPRPGAPPEAGGGRRQPRPGPGPGATWRTSRSSVAISPRPRTSGHARSASASERRPTAFRPATASSASARSSSGAETSRGPPPFSRGRSPSVRGWPRGACEHAQALGNLGSVTREQGDLTGAEVLYRRSLDIRERMAPEGAETGTALIHLGRAGPEPRRMGGGRGVHAPRPPHPREARSQESFRHRLPQQSRGGVPGARPARGRGSVLSAVTEAGGAGQSGQPRGGGQPQQPRRRRRRLRPADPGPHAAGARPRPPSPAGPREPGSGPQSRGPGRAGPGAEAIRPRVAASGGGARHPEEAGTGQREGSRVPPRDGPHPARPGTGHAPRGSDGSRPCGPWRASAAVWRIPSRARPPSARATARSSGT